MHTKILTLLLTSTLATQALAQGTLTDYKRAYEVQRTFRDGKACYTNANPRWQSDNKTFWYIRNTPSGNALVTVDAEALTETVVTDKAVIDSTLHAEAERNRRPASTRHWMEVDDEKGGGPVASPDGQWKAYIKNSNIYVSRTDGTDERQLSVDGTDGHYYSTYLQWSPDSRMVAGCRIRPAEKRYVYYVESSPKDQLQPRLHKQEYAKPGDELRFKVPCIYSIDGTRRLIPSTSLFASQYDLHQPVWSPDSKTLTFEFNERGHKTYRLLEMSAETGSVRTIVEEQSDKYVNYGRIFRHMLSDGKRLLWTSERSGHNHLYLVDRASGRMRPVTSGQWYVRDVVHVDEANELIYFSANGMNTSEDPYLLHYYRVRFDGRDLRCLTPEEGHHRAWFSSDMQYLVDQYSLVDRAPVTVLRSGADGRVLRTLDRADISRLKSAGWVAPEPFVAPGRDGKTLMYGLIQRPTNFDPSRKYPVVEYIYQGPGDHYVRKDFAPYDWWMTSLSELGFIVVMVDGLGTSFRSRDFEQFCYQNLGDAGIPDHIAWIRHAAERYPYMDLDRVGIYGCSAGGQESLSALLHYPDFYKCAYSACGCHDNRMDKIWWNEQWMGYPVDKHYEESSNVVNAHKLRRPLMLVVGEMDDNVDPASTMQVADALIKAGKDFELVVIPGARHTMGEAFGEHKRYDFFVRHLMGVQPPSWDELK